MHLPNSFSLNPVSLMIHLRSLRVLSGWGLPPTLLNPSNSSLTSSFLLPLLPCCPALSSQNPSPINPSFSSPVLPFWLLKRGISGIARTLIFDHLSYLLFLSLVSVSWLRGFLPLSWLLEFSHTWSLHRSMDMLLYSKYSLLFTLSL